MKFFQTSVLTDGVTALESNDRLLERRFPFVKAAAFAAAIIAALAGLFFIYGRLGERHLQLSKDEIIVATARRINFSPAVSAPASVEAIRSASVTAPEGGVVTSVIRQVGDRVQQGEPLLILANPELDRAVAEANSKFVSGMSEIMAAEDQVDDRIQAGQKSLADAEHQWHMANRDYNRQKSLADKGIISAARIDALRDDVRFARTGLDRARRSYSILRENSARRMRQIQVMRSGLEGMVKLQRDRLSALVVRAPMAGIISSLTPEQGAPVSANQAVARVDDDQALRLVAKVPASMQSEMEVGQRAELENIAGASAVVRFIDQTVQNDEVRVILALEGPGQRNLRIGQTLTVRISSGRRRPAVVIDNGELVGPASLFVLSGSGSSAHLRPVRLGRRNGNQVEILEGLAPGERVLTSAGKPVEDATVLDIAQ
jgi:HlyD family secretion protein